MFQAEHVHEPTNLWPNIQTNRARFALLVSDPWKIFFIALDRQYCVTVLFGKKSQKTNETPLMLIYAYVLDIKNDMLFTSCFSV